MVDESRPSRRAFLAGVAGTLAGCSSAREIADSSSPTPVSLRIKTTPADDDPYATRIARHLAKHLELVGVSAEIVPMPTDELLRSLLIDHDFDLYVARHPGARGPDFLRPLVHSKYGSEPGWQNPFGFADIQVDDLVDRQRAQPPAARRETVNDAQRLVARRHPFTVVARSDSAHAVRTDRFVDWPAAGIQSSVDLLSLSAREGVDSDELRITTTDARPTRNLNPLAVTFRDRGLVTGLLYDSLARRVDGRLRPWLARAWRWHDGEHVATLRLRPNAQWHDGRPVTAEDVAFTYRFIADTSLGDGDVPVPSPRFRGRVDLVESVTVVDETTVRFRFDGHRGVARRAFTVPVLPAHEWRPRAREAGVAGVDLAGGTTEALLWDNQEPIGSGPLAFERAVVDELLVLSRVDGHFSAADGGVPYERLTVRTAPSDEAAVELVAVDEADATGPLSAPAVPRVGRAAELSLLVGPMTAFYHVGYNTRTVPLNNPRFRRAVAALIDRAALVDEAFGGYATPAVSPVADEWVAPGLEWDGSASVAPFPRDEGADGDGNGDGDGPALDVERARAAFREAGLRYREDGTLVI